MRLKTRVKHLRRETLNYMLENSWDWKKNWDWKKVLQLDKKVNTLQWMGMKFSEGIWEAYSEPSRRSKMKLFAEIVNSSKLLTIFSKSPILDMLLSYEYASEFFKKTMYRSSFPEVFLGKGVLKICFKFTGKHPCRSVISIKLQSNFIESDFGMGILL